MALEFQGTHTEALLLTLLLGVSAVLCAWGVVQLVRGQRRLGLLGLATAAGPIGTAFALGVDAALRFLRNDPRAGRLSLLAAFVVALLTGAVALAYELFALGAAFWITLLGTQLAVAVGVIYASIFRALGRGRWMMLMALRILAIFALLLILFKPILLFRADAGVHKPVLSILLDRSGSMSTRDRADAPDRHAQALEMLQSQRDRLDEYFQRRWRTFARTVEPARTFTEVVKRPPTGPGTEATNLTAAIQSAGNVRDGVALAGVLLISDGRDNAPGNPAVAAEALGVPVYPLAVGSKEQTTTGRANLQLLRVAAPMLAIVNHATEITARVRMTRFANADAEVELYEGDAVTPVATETIYATGNDETVSAKLRWTPRATKDTEKKSALRKLRVRVAPRATESTADDNEMELHVALTDPKLRVLYIEGAIRPEYKYLRRLLQTDPNVQFAGLVRIDGNRFWSQGKLAGLAPSRLPTSDEDFTRFDVLILGDLDVSFLRRAQQARIRRFVSDGGGLLMLGGQDSFGPGGYAGTDVAAALPVVMGGRNESRENTPFCPQLTPTGVKHPIFSGITEFFPRFGEAVSKTTGTLPDVRGCVRVVRAKSAAAVLAVHPTKRNPAGPLIVLAAQPFGAGRSAALTIDTTWRWYLPLRALGRKSPYARFWGQLIRWLAGIDAKTRQAGALAVLRANRTYARAGQEVVELTARVQQADGTGVEGARVAVTIRPAEGDAFVERLPLAPTATPGDYRGEYTPTQAGAFVITLQALDENGATLGTDELPLTVISQSTELEQTARDDALLRSLARASGGQFAELAALPSLLDTLIARQRQLLGPPPQARTQRLYHFPILFVLFVVFLTAEWALRRLWQLR